MKQIAFLFVFLLFALCASAVGQTVHVNPTLACYSGCTTATAIGVSSTPPTVAFETRHYCLLSPQAVNLTDDIYFVVMSFGDFGCSVPFPLNPSSPWPMIADPFPPNYIDVQLMTFEPASFSMMHATLCQTSYIPVGALGLNSLVWFEQVYAWDAAATNQLWPSPAAVRYETWQQ